MQGLVFYWRILPEILLDGGCNLSAFPRFVRNFPRNVPLKKLLVMEFSKRNRLKEKKVEVITLFLKILALLSRKK